MGRESDNVSDRSKRAIVFAIGTVLVGVIVVALLSTTSAESAADRVSALGQRIRCPVCQNEAIADSPSETAREMLAIVEDKVLAGESDREIERFFIDRYGEWVLLDPPWSGRFVALWALPLLAAIGGTWAIARKKRHSDDVDRAIDRPEDRMIYASQDIAEIAEQAELGEVGRDTAKRLSEIYQSEFTLAAKTANASGVGQAADSAKSVRRAVAGWVAVVLSFAVVVVMAFQAIEFEFSTAAGDDLTGERDLSDVSNEEMERVVAENPDVIGMRMALADRYFDAAQYPAALEHYLEVLKQDSAESQAWARIGWIIYQDGESELAADYVERSLEINPGLPEAELYLGLIYLYGLADPGSAVPLLEKVALNPDLPAEIRDQVATAISVSQQMLGAP